MRVGRTASYRFVFNYSAEAMVLPPCVTGEMLLGCRMLEPGGVTVLN
jgi:hypothetical protein